MEDKQLEWTDQQMIAALKDPRELNKAVRHLYQAHFESLRNHVLFNKGSEQDAADLFQEVIVSFINLVQEDRFRGESSVKTFLFAMNRNLWLNELRRKGRSQEREKNFELQKQEPDARIDQVIEQRASLKILTDLIDQLGTDCKKILLLFYYENRSMKEITDATHYDNEQVVRNKKYKCLKKLEEMITGQKNIQQQLKSFFHG